MKKLLLFVSSVSLGFVSFSANRIVDISDSEKIQIFDEPGSYTFAFPKNATGAAQLLVVGGGGAGGGIMGGGGGQCERYDGRRVAVVLDLGDDDACRTCGKAPPCHGLCIIFR